MGSTLDQMRTDIRGVEWMDEETRAAALDKLEQMKMRAGTPPAASESSLRPRRDDWLGDVLAAQAEHKGLWGPTLIRIGTDRWRLDPMTVNADFDLYSDSLEFPVAILQPPFFEESRLPAINYGAMGTIMGHELTHGLGELGGKFGADGKPVRWWSAASQERFKSLRDCLVKQYSAFQTEPGKNLDGNITAEENAADVGGMALAWAAWNAERFNDPRPRVIADGFSEEQLFFIAFAQTRCEKPDTNAPAGGHSPPRFRVNGTLSDTPGFAETFQCAKGAPGNPTETCSVW